MMTIKKFFTFKTGRVKRDHKYPSLGQDGSSGPLQQTLTKGCDYSADCETDLKQSFSNITKCGSTLVLPTDLSNKNVPNYERSHFIN